MKCVYAHRSIALLCFTLLLATTAQANMVSNGSFETYTGRFGSDGGAQLTQTSTTLTDWAVVGGELNFLTTPDSYNLTASDGVNFLDLAGYTNRGFPKGISQSIGGLNVGQSYSFSMGLGVRNGTCSHNGGTCAGPISVSASIGSASQTFTHNSSDAGNTWGSYGFDFVATAPSEMLTILGQSVPPGGQYIGLDDVAINPGAVAAVPEPASYALMLSGLLAVGAWTGRNRRR